MNSHNKIEQQSAKPNNDATNLDHEIFIIGVGINGCGITRDVTDCGYSVYL